MQQFFSLTPDNSLDYDTAKTHSTHYRSKLYTSKAGVNPLVAAAQPLFSILERINLSDKPPELTTLQANLSHELHAFMTNAETTEHMKEIILVARYLLCATIDEVIEKAYLKNVKNQIIDQTALRFKKITALQEIPSSTELASPDVYFFQILDNAMNKPDFYLDVIELIYFCLITGFEGKYRLDPNGKQNLENLLDRLYQIIQEQKPPTVEKLFVQMIPTRRFAITKTFPWTWLAATLGSILIVGYLIASYQFNQHTNQLLSSSLTHENANAIQRTY